MTYIGPVPDRARSRIGRPLTAALAAACLAVGGAAPALAQDSLPDPNKADAPKPAAKASQSNGSGLPSTGIEASWLTLAGVALLATGVAVRPAARLRRRYRTDAWEQAMRSGS